MYFGGLFEDTAAFLRCRMSKHIAFYQENQ